MSKLLYSATMSLDGYISGAGGDMSWLTEHLAAGAGEAAGLMDAIGALLVGRRTFTGDDPNRGTDAEGAFGGQWHGPSVVLTHDRTLETDEDGVTFVDELVPAVDRARTAAGGKYVNVLGADVARQCLEAGLLDEILVFVAPVLLGDGTRLFHRPGGTRVPLAPIDPPVGGSTGHWFRVLR